MGWLMLMLCAKVVGFVGVRGVKADVDAVVLRLARRTNAQIREIWTSAFQRLVNGAATPIRRSVAGGIR
jgi:hypothetical protein